MVQATQQFVGREARDPNSVLDHGLNWGPYLKGDDTITASSWSISPSGMTILSSSFTDTTTSVKISGGTIGTKYVLTNRVTLLTSGQIDERSIELICVER